MKRHEILTLLDHYESRLDGRPLESLKLLRNGLCRTRSAFDMDTRKGRDKAMRWLGWLQGVLWAQGTYSVKQLASHNKWGPPHGAQRINDARDSG